jgi:ABC-type polysaccharide/polyol phosphate transport system ATPase subunit
MSSEIAIKVENLSKCYEIYDQPRDRLKQFVLPRLQRIFGLHIKSYCRKFWALRSVSIEVRRGETLGIIGRNGSGKSTLLQLICGTLNPSSGSLAVSGRVAALLELGSGFNPEFTGRENVFLNATILGLSREEIDARYEKIETFADIGEFIDRPVKTYSSGMVVRLAFAVASSVDPEILIVDEALAVGDAEFQAKCFRRFQELRQRGVTVVLVTHDIGTVIQLCNRAVILHNGELLASGLPKEMGDEYRRLCAEDVFARRVSRAVEVPTLSIRDVEYDVENWTPLSSQTQEYGDGRAKIESFAVVNGQGDLTTSLRSDESMHLRVRLRFLESCAAPIAAFGIRDLSGMELCGSNTWYEEKDIGFVEKGEVVTVDFRFQLRLQSGVYNLSIACTELSAEGLTVLHRLFDVAVLEVSATRRFVGRFDPKPLVHVFRSGN